MKRSAWLLVPVILFLVVVWSLASAETDEVVFTEGVIFTDHGLVFIDVAHLDGNPDEVLAELGAVRADAYTLLGFSQSVNPIPYQYNSANAPVAQSVVEGGITGWNHLSDHDALIVGTTSLSAGLCHGQGGDGQYVVDWAPIEGLAIGIACWGSSGECDQRYDSSYSGNATLWHIVSLHEMGHCWGLGHTTISPAIMAPSVGFVTELQPDDIAGFCAIYGCSSPATPTPTSTSTLALTPSFTPSPTPTQPTATSTHTQSPTASPTATASPTPNSTPPPTGTPGPGDADCNGVIDARDALKVLQIIAGIGLPCHVFAINVARDG